MKPCVPNAKTITEMPMHVERQTSPDVADANGTKTLVILSWYLML